MRNGLKHWSCRNRLQKNFVQNSRRMNLQVVYMRRALNAYPSILAPLARSTPWKMQKPRPIPPLALWGASRVVTYAKSAWAGTWRSQIALAQWCCESIYWRQHLFEHGISLNNLTIGLVSFDFAFGGNPCVHPNTICCNFPCRLSQPKCNNHLWPMASMT